MSCHYPLFFDQICQINQRFPNLFNKGDSEDSEQGNEGETDETDAGGNGDSFQDKWGWIANVDEVSETCRCSWDDVWKMDAVEFLSIICYKRDKAAKDKEELEKWKRTH